MPDWEDIEFKGKLFPFWQWDENGVLEGTFLGTRTIRTQDKFKPGEMRESIIHDVKMASGTIGANNSDTVSVWGSADLDGKLNQVSVGDMVRIEYVDKEDLLDSQGKKTGKSMKVFDVKRAPAREAIEVAAGADDDDIPF